MPQDLTGYGFSQKLYLYNKNPDYFTPAEADKLESQAISNGIYFQRKGDHATDDTGVIEQFVSGFVEGAVLLGWADEPDTQAEKLAAKMGHLVGFAPDIIAAAFTMGGSLTGTAAKIAAKSAVKAGVKKGGAGLGIQLGGDWAKSKVMSAARAVHRYTAKTGGHFGLEVGKKGGAFRSTVAAEAGPIPILGSLRSVPMRGADFLTDLASRKLTENGMLTAGFFAKGTVPRNMIKTGVHLGLASGISSIKEGPAAMAESFAFGAVAGAAFGGIGEITRIDRFLKHPNPRIQKLGTEGIRKGAGALLGAGFQGGMSSAMGAPTEDQIYEYLLGAFFGASSRSVHEITGNKFINDLQVGKVNPETGARERNWYDIHRYKDMAEWKDMQPAAKEYVNEHIIKSSGTFIESVQGTDVFVALAKKAKLENTSLTEAADNYIRKEIKKIDKQDTDVETGLNKQDVTQDLPSLSEGRRKLLLESSQEIADIESKEAKKRWIIKEPEGKRKGLVSKTIEGVNPENGNPVELVLRFSKDGKITKARVQNPNKAIDGFDVEIGRFHGDPKKDFEGARRLNKNDDPNIVLERVKDVFEPKKMLDRAITAEDKFRIGNIKTRDPESSESQGVGTALFEAIKKEFIAKGRDHIDIETNAGSEGFWEKMGFKFTGETVEGYPIESSKYSGTQRAPKEQYYGRYTYTYDLKPEIEAFESKFKGANHKKPSAAVDYYTSELAKFTSVSEMNEGVGILDVSEFLVPRNRLDFMAVDVKIAYPNKELPQIRRDFHLIKEESDGTYADFHKKLTDKYPKVRLDEHDLKHYLLKEANNHKVKLHTYSEVDGELRESRDYGMDNKRNVLFKPKSELEKKFGDADIGPITRIEVAKPNVEGIERRTYLEPFDTYRVFEPDPSKGEGAGDWVFKPAISKEGWVKIQSGLDEKGHYIISARKDDNVLIPYKYHPESIGYEKSLKSLRKEMKDAGFGDISKDLEKDWAMEQERLDLLSGKYETSTIEAHKEIWRKKVASNILWARDVESAKNFSELNERWTFKNVVDYNKRVMLMNGQEIPMNVENFNRSGDKFLNTNNEFEFILVNDTGPKSLIKNKSKETFTTQDNKKVPYESQLDGVVEVPPAMFDRMLEINGYERNVGFMKPVMTIYHPELGSMLVKSGLFKTGPTHLKLSGDNRIIIWSSSGKSIGKRKPAEVSYNQKTGKWEGSPDIYTLKPEHFKINLDVSESKQKSTKPQQMLKQMFGYANREQVEPVDIDMIYNKIIRRTIDGYSNKGGKFIYNDMITEFFEKGTSDLRKNEIQKQILTSEDHWPDRLSRKILIKDILTDNPNSIIAREFIKYIFEKGKNAENTIGEWAYDNKATISEVQQMTGYERQLKAGKYQASTWLYDGALNPIVEKSVENYLNTRMLKPRWRDGGSGAAYFYPYSIGEQLKHKLKPGDVLFGSNWKDPSVKIRWTVGTKFKIPLIEAWNQYQTAIKDKSVSPEQIWIMEKDLEFVVARSPMGGISGARLLRFRGFSDKQGWGMLTHMKDDFYMGGLDKDGDSGKWFQGFPKEMKDMFRNTQNELEINGKALDIKEPRLDSEFGIDPNESTSAAMATKGSGFMPNMRIEAGQAAYNGKRSMGVVENSKQQIQVMLSTLNTMGGETTLPVIGAENKNLGTLKIKLRKANVKTGEIDEIVGDTFRYYGYNASNRATDASNYPKMKNGSEMRELLVQKAFELQFIDTNGRHRQGTWWDLVKTDFGIISDVNQKLYGRNWDHNRRWNSDEIQQTLNRLTESEIPWEGILAKMGRDISGDHVNLDMSDRLDPVKVIKMFRDKQQLYRNDFSKDLMARTDLRIGQWNLPKGYFKGDKTNSFRFNSDVEDIVGADIVIETGNKAYEALQKAGKSREEAIVILNDLLRSADNIKKLTESSRKSARSPEVSSARNKYDASTEIRGERKNAIDRANAHNVDPRLFLKYWDMYFISPLRFQDKAMRNTFNKEQKNIYDTADWFADKFGEKITQAAVDKNVESLSSEELLAANGILKALKKHKKDFYKTDQLNFARETEEIPIDALAEYLKHKSDLIESMQRKTNVPKEEILDTDVNDFAESRKSAREITKKISQNFETPLEEWLPDFELARQVSPEKLKNISKETLKDLEILDKHLSDPRNGTIKDDFAQFFADFTATNEPVGRPLESMTPEDVKFLNNFFKQANDGEWLLKYAKNSEGDLSPMMSKWLHHSLYTKVGKHAFTADRQLIQKYGVPLRKANGDLIFVRGKQPVSAMSYLNKIGQSTIRHKDKFVNFEQQYRDKEVLGMLLDETVIHDQFELFDIAIAKHLKDGSGINTSAEGRKYYRKMYDDIVPALNRLQEKGKTYKYINELGKQEFLDAEQFTDIIIKKVSANFDRLYKKWFDPTYDPDRTVWDKKFESQFTFKEDGRMSLDLLRQALSGISHGKETMGDLDVKGIRTMIRIENELVMEQILEKSLNRLSEQYTESIKRKGLTGVKLNQMLKAEQLEKKKLRDKYRNTVEMAPAGFIEGNYFPQIGHLSVKANESAVLAHVSRQVQNLFDNIMRSPKDYLSPAAYNVYELGKKGKPGGRTLEEIAAAEASKLDSRMQRHLQRDTQVDRGELEHMVRLMEQGENGNPFPSSEISTMLQKAREMGFFQTPGNFKSRGIDFMPHFRTDADVIKSYTESTIASYFNHLYALQSKLTIDDFVRRNPMGIVKGKNAVGEEIDVDLTQRWASFMRDVSKKVLGYPTHFTSEAGESNATFIGSSKKMMNAYKRTLKTGLLNKISKDKINAAYIGMGAAPLPTFENKKEEKAYLLKNQLYVDVLRGALKKETNPLRVYGSGYYYTSDAMMVEMIQKVGEKLAGRDAAGNPKLPWKKLPTDPIARKLALTNMVHKFGAFEAKWSLATLLTHPKTAIGNMMGGSMNTITNSSFRHWKNAGNYEYLIRNVFKGATLEDGITKINSKETIGRHMEELGVLEAFYVQEIGLDPTFSQSNRKVFMNEVVKRVAKRGLFGAEANDTQIKETVMELAAKYKINDYIANKAAYFMRVSERPIRQRAYLSQYLNARESLQPITSELPFDSPWLIQQAIKGVTATQFLYNSAARSNYSNTAIGKVMTRFQPFAWNSLAFRRSVYQDAKMYGFKPGTKNFERFRRQMAVDLFVFGLGNVFASSIFEYSMPPPMSWLQDTAQFFFGEEKERERAFFSQWPVVSKNNVLAPLQPFTPPIMRYPLNTVALFTEGGLEKFSQYYIWTWFPFGRAARDLRKTIMSPAMIVENATGVPLHQIHTKSRNIYKNWFPEDESPSLELSPYQQAYKGL